MKELFKSIIKDFHSREIPQVFHRNINIPINSGKIITLIGARRTGKTYLFYQIMNELQTSIGKENLVYINFEDERLSLSSKELTKIIDAYYELYPLSKNSTYFFFDEIQNIDGWEKFVRRIYDTISKNIFITGSSSKLLSKEIATSLRGRTVSFEVFPFSFSEFLSYKGIDFEDQYSTKNKALIINNYDEYLMYGSFPETINLRDDLRRKTLQSYFDVMLYRDLIERYDLKNPAALKYFIKKAISNTGNKISVNKLYNELKSQGIKTSKDAVYGFIIQAHDSYILFPVNYYSESVSIQVVNEKKLYCIDNGLANTVSFKFSEDRGRMLENIIFLNLRRHNEGIFYHKGKGECDFVVQDRNNYHVIQVTKELNSTNQEREINGLIEAMDRFNLKEGHIITEEFSNTIDVGDKKIFIEPVWKWLLGADTRDKD